MPSELAADEKARRTSSLDDVRDDASNPAAFSTHVTAWRGVCGTEGPHGSSSLEWR